MAKKIGKKQEENEGEAAENDNMDEYVGEILTNPLIEAIGRQIPSSKTIITNYLNSYSIEDNKKLIE